MRDILGLRSAIALFGAAMTLAGCATVAPPPITSDTMDLDLKGSGIAVIGVSLTNTFRVTPLISALETYGVVINQLEPGGKRERLFFEAGKPLSRSDDHAAQHEEQMLGIKLPPGRYQLVCVSTTVAKMGFGCAPICADFSIAPLRIAYLGHVDIVRRERLHDGEPRAGYVLPAFDQWYSGFSGGTFDVAIRNAYDQDVALWKGRYPVLADKLIDDAALTSIFTSQFDLESETCGR